jgi:ABC-type multidrug transport system ATPase subunit
MIQAIGLTSPPRRTGPPAVDEVTFEARPGHVTVLLGTPGAGKTTALRLMLQLRAGRGIALFRGRPLDRIPHPSREVGVMLGDVPGHPARTVRGHLRMLAAAAGIPYGRCDQLLELVELSGVGHRRLESLSLGMDRRLGLATALLGEPHTLVLDEPADGLSPQERSWLYRLLRCHAAQSGTVLVTAHDPVEATRLADRVVTLDVGRLVADQTAADFSRTRLRPRVVVRSPHAVRLADLLTKQPWPDGPVEVVRESGTRICVYGSNCAAVGETAFRHGILVHQLADEIADAGPGFPLGQADGRLAAHAEATASTQTSASMEAPASTALAVSPPVTASAETSASTTPRRPPRSTALRRPPRSTALAVSPPVIALAEGPAASPSSPSAVLPQTRVPAVPIRRAGRPGLASFLGILGYEVRRAGGVWTGWFVAAATVAASLLAALVSARVGGTSSTRALVGWPAELPLPPTALGAGLLGARAFGLEFRYPALIHAVGPITRRFGLFAVKGLVCTAVAAVLAAASLAVNGMVLRLVFGTAVSLPADWAVAGAGWTALVMGCTWVGLLAAGLFRSTSLGLAAVVAVPVAVAPAAQALFASPASWSLGEPAEGHRSAAVVQRLSDADHWVSGALSLGTEPVGQAFVLSLCALLSVYLLLIWRRKAR